MPALLVEIESEVAQLTFNRPARSNSFDLEMLQALHAELDRLGKDTAVEAVVLTGAGESAFCAGAELELVRRWVEERDTSAETGPALYRRVIERLLHFPKPTLARVNGPAVAGGLGFMLSCHQAVMVDEAHLATAGLRLGMFPMILLGLMLEQIPPKVVLEMAISQRRLTAEEAVRMGLAQEAVSRRELDEAVDRRTAMWTGSGPEAMRAGLEAVAELRRARIGDFDRFEEQLNELMQTRGVKKGLKEFFRNGSLRGR